MQILLQLKEHLLEVKIKNKKKILLIILGVLINLGIGIILIIQSFKGHSSLGFLFGAFMPILSILFYSNYLKLSDASNEKGFKKLVFRPSLLIGILILIISIVTSFMVLDFDYLENTLTEFVQFFGAIILLFMIPNLIYQIVIFQLYKKGWKQMPAANNG